MRHHTAFVLGAVTALALVTAACGGDDLTESFLENQIQSESGEDVDIDFNIEDGEFSIQTEDGKIEISADEDGNVSIEGLGEDGEFSIDGSVGDGEAAIETDEGNGEVKIETEDGSATLSSGGELPDDFPDAVPLPGDLSIIYSQAADTPDGSSWALLATTPGESDQVASEYLESLEDAGFAQVSLMTADGGSFFSYEGDGWSVSGFVASDEPGTTTLSVNVIPLPSD